MLSYSKKKLGYLSFVFISKLDLHTRLTSLPIYLCKVQNKIKINLSLVIYEQKWNIVHGFYFLQKYLKKKKSEDTWPLKSLFWRKFCYFYGFYFLLKYLQKKKSEDYLSFKISFRKKVLLFPWFLFFAKIFAKKRRMKIMYLTFKISFRKKVLLLLDRQ